MTMREAARLGVERFDVILITGDAYVDHPSFGTAIVGRVLWDAGYTVGVIAQPDWRTDLDFTRLGRPRLFFGISSGNVDSMVNHYTPARKQRSEDVYSPGGVRKRPDRAVIVYANRVRALNPGVPIVLGGIEASLRRFAHYDYWDDRVRQSILADAPADLLVFGMGERQILTIAHQLDAEEPVHSLGEIPGTMVTTEVKRWRVEPRQGAVEIPSYTDVAGDPHAFARAFALLEAEQDPVHGRPVAQPHPKTVVIQNPPSRPLSTIELDHVYELPYARLAHPAYRQPVPALATVQFSVTSHRGCFGACSFCALTHHQGRLIQSRSAKSIVREVERMAKMPQFKGIVQDVGGPTANMYGCICSRWDASGACRDRWCSPDCPSLVQDYAGQVALLERLRGIPGVKQVFISSGIRHDLLVGKDSGEYLDALCAHHVSGHLKVAPEHIAGRVTEAMHKPPKATFDEFAARFSAASARAGKEQYLLPYFMSGHPACTIADMIELAEYIRDRGLYTEQVQDFTPTPMTAATCMYHTGIDPRTGTPVHVAKGREKQIQRAMLHYRDRTKEDLVREGLVRADRRDLIGAGKGCLVPERAMQDGRGRSRDTTAFRRDHATRKSGQAGDGHSRHSKSGKKD